MFISCLIGVESSSAQLIMDVQGRKCAQAWSTQEVVDLIAVWGEESVQAELRTSRRNTDIYAKIVQGMGEKGYTRDPQQCRLKIKELRQAYQKTREANSHSGCEPQTSCFYKELHAILGGDPTTAPKRSVDTSQEPWVTSGNNKEDIVDEEEENARQASRRYILPDSQELFLTLEPIHSQDQLVVERDAREGTSAQTLSVGTSSTLGQRLSQIRRRKKKTQEDMFNELMRASESDKMELSAWRIAQ
ncbi:zinc finger and SCAN domain-containing protein 29-like [Mauremys mutica]|uniref:zinc finger and SCAN domain-containing protein 29-like n=1 Tax=Mauremys mutica TaxID=74926 RepID=UPI001D15C4F4|nr:zinc finger and SCAN domain-containing protein 29-like [Mauremys mutica]